MSYATQGRQGLVL
jgi:hypothetical protein